LNFPPLTGDSRIGVHPDEFGTAIDLARQAGLTVSGLHFYRGTGTNATQAFVAAIDTILSIASQLPDLAYLDFGGGFGYPYHHEKAAFDWLEFGQILSAKLARLDRKVQLTIEPGRAAIAGCAVLLAQVVATKWQGEKQVVGVDSTVANLSVPSVYGGYREIVSWENSGALYTTDVCGNTTYSRDYLGRIETWFDRWTSINNVPAKILPSLQTTNLPTAPNPEVTAYSFDRVIVCDNPIVAQLLISNNFHFENNCAILTIDGYPQSIFGTTMEMLRRNSELKN
jgi:Pyridoxal-dependent decarboxylase, pyridoxal binding domain/Pyridoxal-dependent decarboxylase, C-terminal sheet domain